MENEGIMALPQGASMSGEQAPQQQTVSSADSYDAAQTALGMTSPGDQEAVKAAIRESLADEQLSPQELQSFIVTFEELSQNPAGYPVARQQLIDNDYIDPEDLPEEYDPEFLGAVLAVLNEMQLMQAQGAMEPMQMSPTVEGLAPMGMAEGGLASVASYLASQGRNGDSMLAHITPEEAALLKRRGGSGTINPVTGLPEFFLKKLFKKVTNVVKKVLKSPVGRILGTIALATVLGPTAIGLSLGSAGTAALASGAVTLAGGGSIKEALISGAMGYIGGGGTIMGASPLTAVGGYLPGAAGSALNTGLATGVIGAGVGKLGGMSTQDALKMGLTSGLSAAAMQGLENTRAGQVAKDAQFRSEVAGQPQGTGTATDLLASPAQGPVGAPGQVGTAQDLLGAQAPGGSMPADYQAQYYKDIGIDPRTMSSTSVGASPTNIQIERGSLGMTGIGDTARQFMSEPLNVAKDIYNTNLSPSRAGLPADAGLIQKYGPLALAGTAVMGATGGFKGTPADENPAFDRNYTGMDYMRDNPGKFTGGLSTYTSPSTPVSPIVPTPSYGTIPIGQAATTVPMGITNNPRGVAQPYNMAGMYGVPLVYGPDGQPQRLAKGGSPVPTEFPRKNGPINGPGTGTSDDIPAMLSDGEFVFTAKAVRNAGNGSRRKGAARMYKLMKMLEGGPVKGK
jgi:hypothetical protein